MRFNALPIKTRVTLYYSFAMIFISLLIFSGFFFASKQQTEAVSKDTVIGTVQNSFEDIVCNDGVIEISSDFDVYQDGVTLLIYDENGNLLKGAVPRGFPYFTPLSSGKSQKIDEDSQSWFVHDVFMFYENGQGLYVRGIYSLDNVERTVNSYIRIMLVILPLILMLAIVTGALITKRAFMPIERMIKAADSISGGSDLSKRLPKGKAKDELYYLAETLNLMIERLENAFSAEKQFSSDVSHELKTPISVMIAECEYALRKERSAEEYKESLRTMEEQCKRLTYLITQLLQLSETIDPSEAIEKEETDLSALCRNVCEELRVFAEKNGTELLMDIDDNVIIEADETLIMRMLINLITNGIKYRRKDCAASWVKLSLKAGTPVRIIVSDNGTGMEAEELKKIFNRFYKVDKSRTGQKDSFGLGLSIVKWISEAHRGQVKAESVPGEGSVFTVTL